MSKKLNLHQVSVANSHLAYIVSLLIICLLSEDKYEGGVIRVLKMIYTNCCNIIKEDYLSQRSFVWFDSSASRKLTANFMNWVGHLKLLLFRWDHTENLDWVRQIMKLGLNYTQ